MELLDQHHMLMSLPVALICIGSSQILSTRILPILILPSSPQREMSPGIQGPLARLPCYQELDPVSLKVLQAPLPHLVAPLVALQGAAPATLSDRNLPPSIYGYRICCLSSTCHV